MGRRKRRKASRGAPQTMPSDGTAPCKHGQRELPRVAHLGEKPSVVSKETPAMSEGGTAVQDVPVRQIQLQKSMNDGWCSFLPGKLGGKRNANLRLRRRAERRTRGRELQLVVASPVSALRFGNETEDAVGNCGGQNQLVLFSERRQSRNRGETLENARAHVGGTRFGSMMLASPFTGARADGSWSLSS